MAATKTLKSQRRFDDHDLAIVSELSIDGRISASDLANRINLSRPAISRRMTALRDSGIFLHEGLQIDYSRVGFDLHVMVELDSPSKKYARLQSLLLATPEVLAISVVSGSGTIILDVVALNSAHLKIFLKQLQEFGNTRTSLIFMKKHSGLTLIQRLRKAHQKFDDPR